MELRGEDIHAAFIAAKVAHYQQQGDFTPVPPLAYSDISSEAVRYRYEQMARFLNDRSATRSVTLR